jgi:hypothetical protein
MFLRHMPVHFAVVHLNLGNLGGRVTHQYTEGQVPVNLNLECKARPDLGSLVPCQWATPTPLLHTLT